MRQRDVLVLCAALPVIAWGGPAAAACTSRGCPDQLQIDDLRARVAARCD